MEQGEGGGAGDTNRGSGGDRRAPRPPPNLRTRVRSPPSLETLCSPEQPNAMRRSSELVPACLESVSEEEGGEDGRPRGRGGGIHGVKGAFVRRPGPGTFISNRFLATPPPIHPQTLPSVTAPGAAGRCSGRGRGEGPAAPGRCCRRQDPTTAIPASTKNHAQAAEHRSAGSSPPGRLEGEEQGRWGAVPRVQRC